MTNRDGNQHQHQDGHNRHNRHSDADQDDLAQRLRTADPAASLHPLSREATDRLKETIVKSATSTSSTPATAARRPRPRTRTLVAAGAGLLVAAGIVVAVVVSSSPGATHLTAGTSGIAAKCIAPDAERVGAATLAFQATVTSIDDGTVTMHVTERFAGETSDTVTVAQAGDEQISDGGPLHYETGERYLIAATDGQILSCGLSGIASPELHDVYTQAFGQPKAG
ncbi:hypothetical protein ACL9RL_03915 [Plantibacter sp. Mn2098]|uniref:hypothetical protein n=1 Tax=Plantibacter sp. Mn2098 TaxID=3395266 RepID=UPI003BD97370